VTLAATIALGILMALAAVLILMIALTFLPYTLMLVVVWFLLGQPMP
jgi:hypothetical protein